MKGKRAVGGEEPRSDGEKVRREEREAAKGRCGGGNQRDGEMSERTLKAGEGKEALKLARRLRLCKANLKGLQFIAAAV